MENENTIQPPAPAPVVQQTPPVSPTSPKTSKRLMILVILFIVIAMVGIVAYALGVKTQIPPTVQPTPLAVVQPTPTPDPTANWKTYTNVKFGFTLQYPPEWKLYEQNSPLVISGVMISPDCDLKKQSICPNIDISISANSTKEEFNKLVDYDRNNNFLTKESNYQINSVDAIELQIALKRQEGEYVNRITKVFMWRNSIVYIINYVESYTIDLMKIDLKKELPEWGYKNMLDQILSTFKFLD